MNQTTETVSGKISMDFTIMQRKEAPSLKGDLEIHPKTPHIDSNFCNYQKL